MGEAVGGILWGLQREQWPKQIYRHGWARDRWVCRAQPLTVIGGETQYGGRQHGVEPLAVRQRQPTKKSGHLTVVLWPEDDVPVIGH